MQNGLGSNATLLHQSKCQKCVLERKYFSKLAALLIVWFTFNDPEKKIFARVWMSKFLVVPPVRQKQSKKNDVRDFDPNCPQSAS